MIIENTKFVVSPTHHSRLANDRNMAPSGTVDLTYVVTIIQKYRDECDQHDPYVHSSFVSRITDLIAFFSDIKQTALDNNDLLCVDIALALVMTALERNTNFEQRQPTPSEAVNEVFDDEFLDVLRDQLGNVPFYVFPENPSELVIDLLSVTRLAMRMSPNIWMSQEEEDRAHEDRIMGRTMEFEIIDEADVVGDEHAISDFDEWAEAQNFPWDSDSSNFES